MKKKEAGRKKVEGRGGTHFLLEARKKVGETFNFYSLKNPHNIS